MNIFPRNAAIKYKTLYIKWCSHFTRFADDSKKRSRWGRGSFNSMLFIKHCLKIHQLFLNILMSERETEE
jgi:hypothetical protein